MTGAGGGICEHRVDTLRRLPGVRVHAVNIRPLGEWYQVFPDVEKHACPVRGNVLDLQLYRAICFHKHVIYQLAADTGGMGII